MTAHLRLSPVTTGTWAVDGSRTRITFTVGHLRGEVAGSLTLGRGEVVVDASGAPVHASAAIDLGSLDTGVARRDADLRKPRFLDSDRTPTMTWTADGFRRGEAGEWTADGVLSLRGTSAALPVRATPEPVGTDGDGLRIRGTAVLDRTSIGIRAPRFVIGREVRIEVDAWLTRTAQD